ncbi:unnamed protein product [Effrenium voratum]|uniref:WSC domain-containing protein n=1 Tax=Effrenium voratum TaxID=2562239 RepID=A0AA36J1L3_9DINO|nr:unnamed protein product [Effrenium voratum]CAJ1397937.1 unnamed protein product [Effrenium voratum]CAJ1439556.1 unnamed protein product [Effrenium voratum]|eukprot:CAMPEP_0181411638 /NCGR_PEP_ID=MMETSP1110-20121109/7985_1 /TAXON_ID=174948 /ORGANISM="Symbiodinium sp., Strain CCMP421" /LENGTH=221 /DNA_ID=CAMNT_0023534277 /DNA_START=48 /DNA_END=713 /DNA_ORIENTATION=+
MSKICAALLLSFGGLVLSKRAEGVDGGKLDMGKDDMLSLDDVAPRSMAEVGESLEVNASRAEDVECFCINPYIYADLDDEDYRGGSAWGQCVGDHGARHGPHGIRCNEICEDKRKFVYFEGSAQTLSFCGNDNGGFTGQIECQCLDGLETFQNQENKKIAQKRYRKGKIDDPNTLWMLKVKHTFNSQYNANGNLKDCYSQCPAVCRQHEMVIGGCAMPVHA